MTFPDWLLLAVILLLLGVPILVLRVREERRRLDGDISPRDDEGGDADEWDSNHRLPFG